MNVDRLSRWRSASYQSFWFDSDLSEIVWLLQMLGREDVVLYAYDEMLNADYPNINAGNPTESVDDLLHGMTWRAYTWVLASYELIRTISGKLKSLAPAQEIFVNATLLKNDFSRLRVPLAKFEPASKHKHTDYLFPQHCVQPNRGFCWAVSDEAVISRMELSDSLLNFLMDLKGFQVNNS